MTLVERQAVFRAERLVEALARASQAGREERLVAGYVTRHLTRSYLLTPIACATFLAYEVRLAAVQKMGVLHLNSELAEVVLAGIAWSDTRIVTQAIGRMDDLPTLLNLRERLPSALFAQLVLEQITALGGVT